ncbi:hypothetical protein [Limnoraphis robusta]|uniref:Uncharacterized protein n=1 Tax=Limnoraphis robusta CS-951 TaxID=1637645 RepID=A0A0F5Y9C1_9CYAN|nr:hypothetical protein [Limnoraphis robusta]KKD34805.1 hypothetical protein WN50_28825 [Limnoraphis robusta CS-951]
MGSRLSVSLSDEITEVVKLALSLSGKSQNAACTQWIMEGALREIALFKKAQLLKKPNFPYELPDSEDEPDE